MYHNIPRWLARRTPSRPPLIRGGGRSFEGEIVGERVRDGVRIPVQPLERVTPLDTDTGAIEPMSLWTGESVGGVGRMQPAAAIVRGFAGVAERLLERGPAVVQGAIG